MEVKTDGPKLKSMLASMFPPAEWGDGSLIDGIMQLIEKLLPLIMGCFPMGRPRSRTRFVRAFTKLANSRRRQSRLQDMCDCNVCQVDDVDYEDRVAVSDEAATAVIDFSEGVTTEQAGELFDELTAA